MKTYTESELQELLRQQRMICASKVKSDPKKFWLEIDINSILNAPSPLPTEEEGIKEDDLVASQKHPHPAASLASHSCAIGNSFQLSELDAYKMLINQTFSLELNANDFFAYATAMGTTIDAYDVEWVIPIIRKYGNDGLNACIAYIQNYTPIKPWITERFLSAINDLATAKQPVFGDTDYGDNYSMVNVYRMLNSDKNDERNASQQQANQGDDLCNQIKISELREKFFKECVPNCFKGIVDGFGHDRFKTIDPNEVFEWFKPYLKIPSIDWEGLKSDFIDACKRLHYHQLFNWLKTNLQDYIK